MDAISIEPYTRELQEPVGQLIISIQRDEFKIPITLADQPDLADIENFYQKGKGNFWCALQDGKVVGTIALIDIGEGNGVIRKMFVSPDFRSRESQVAWRLLMTLENWAKESHIHTIYLGTIDRFIAANKFYIKNGYSQIQDTLLPAAFPKMKVDNTFFKKALV